MAAFGGAEVAAGAGGEGDVDEGGGGHVALVLLEAVEHELLESGAVVGFAAADAPLEVLRVGGDVSAGGDHKEEEGNKATEGCQDGEEDPGKYITVE